MREEGDQQQKASATPKSTLWPK